MSSSQRLRARSIRGFIRSFIRVHSRPFAVHLNSSFKPYAPLSSPRLAPFPITGLSCGQGGDAPNSACGWGAVVGTCLANDLPRETRAVGCVVELSRAAEFAVGQVSRRFAVQLLASTGQLRVRLASPACHRWDLPWRGEHRVRSVKLASA